MKASDKWEEAALKKAYELDLPGSGIDVRCTHTEELLPILYDGTLTPYQIIERLHPAWSLETINSMWLRLRKDNDTVEFEVIGNGIIGYISMFWNGE